MNIYNHNNLFLPNKYTTWYYNIIENAKSQPRIKLSRDNPDYIYYENHHILPSCLFKEYSNLRENNWNGVLLTAKEHFICHALLCKMVDNNYKIKLYSAFNKLQYSDKNQQRYTSKLYEYFKLKWIIYHKNIIVSDETKKKISLNSKYKKWYSNDRLLKSIFTENINLNEEWYRGRKYFNNLGAKIGGKIQSNKIWINNGEHEFMCHKEKLNNFPDYNKGRLYTKTETKIKQSKFNKKKKWWTKDSKSIFTEFAPDETWKRGRIFIRKGQIRSSF